MDTKTKFPGMFDVDAALEQIEKNAKIATDMIIDKKSREVAETIASASMEFARAQTEAAKAFADALKKIYLP